MGGRVTPRHMLAVLLTFPVAWMVHRAYVAWKHFQSPQTTPEDADDAVYIARMIVDGEDDGVEAPGGGIVHVEGVFLRFQFAVALFCVIGFLLGYGVSLCLHL